MSRNSCKGCEYSQKCELVKMTKEERKRREEIEEEIKKYIGGNKMVKDYMKKQVMIQAVVWTGDNTHEITKFMAQGLCEVDDFQTRSKQLVIPTLEGDHRASIGDYIIKGVKGEFYPCKPDIFEMSYEEVEKCKSVKEADPKKELGRAFANLQNIGTVQIPKLIEELSGEDEEVATAYVIKYMKFMQNIDNEEVAQKIIDDLMK